MLFSLYFSFTNYGLQQIAGLEPTKTVGLKNYRQLLDDPKVASSLKNTFIYTRDDGAGEDHRRARCSRCS